MKRVIAILVALLMTTVMVAGSACGPGFTTETFLPGLSFSNLTVSPNPAEIGQTVTVSVDVTNEGNAGTFPTPLMVDGAAVGVEMVELEAGASETVTYNWVATFGGSYEIALGDQTETLVITPSTMQNILKMVPADWNAFLYFGAETMRTDTATAPDKGLADLWNIGNSYLQFFAGADYLNIDTEAYPAGDLPFTLAQLDYLAFAIGGLEEMDFDEEGAMPNMTLMISVTGATPANIAAFLNDFQNNWFGAGEGIDFVDGTYNGVNTWTVDVLDPGGEDPGVTVAVIEGSTIILIGPTADVEECIDVIQTAGDDDSMFENDNIRGIMGDFGNPILMAVADGDIPLPDNDGGDGPELPESVAVTAGIAMEKIGETMRVQAILEVGEMGNWLALLTDAIPTPQEMLERREEDEREDEFWRVQEAVHYMMWDNGVWDLGLGGLPNPVSTPTQSMGAFPDATSQDGNKPGYTFPGDRPGYTIYDHDGIPNGVHDDPWTYVGDDLGSTQYYYTCEADGTVHQWEESETTPGTFVETTPDIDWD